MSKVKDGIYGVIVGDMLGVPVEFEWREKLAKDPVTGPRANGSHEQPLGAWSDDTSLTLALADALIKDFSLQTISQNFIDWWQQKKYTSHDVVFDIGERTRLSLNQLFSILETKDYEALEFLHYEAKEDTNGNGALMRILPLYFYLQDKGIEDNFEVIWQVSTLTHPHVRSAIVCLIYLVMIDELIKCTDIQASYRATRSRIQKYFDHNTEAATERAHFSRLIDEDITSLQEEEIESSAYVVHTLEASFWSLLTTSSYKEAVLKAVNLGHDTDTTGAVTGGLAGIFYGFDAIPEDWVTVLPKKSEIDSICDKLNNKYGTRN